MAKKKIKLDKDKPIHPYSRKAKQLRRELLKQDKVKKPNPLKELLLFKFRIFKTFLEESKIIPLTFKDIDQVLESYFTLDDTFSTKNLISQEKLHLEQGHGIEIPKVTCAKLCKRILAISKLDWSCIETLELMKYNKR